MTKPQITSHISLGNIIQIALIVVGLAGAWFTMEHRTEAAAAGLNKNSVELSQIEVRVRALETRAAADTEQLRTLQRDISELKQGQRETNGLLRQLLQRGSLE